MTERFTHQQLCALAANAVHKVDLLGPRGTTLVTCDEVEAMACMLAMSGMLPPLFERLPEGQLPKFNDKEQKQ